VYNDSRDLVVEQATDAIEHTALGNHSLLVLVYATVSF
jgi:hypothetical protein